MKTREENVIFKGVDLIVEYDYKKSDYKGSPKPWDTIGGVEEIRSIKLINSEVDILPLMAGFDDQILIEQINESNNF